jgi:hypothetical protein
VPFLGGGLSTWNAMDTEWRRRRSAFLRFYRTADPQMFDLHNLAGVAADGLRPILERFIVADLVTKLVGGKPANAEVIEVTDLLRQLAGTFWSTKMPGPHPLLGEKTRRAIVALERLVQGWLGGSSHSSPIRLQVGDLTDAQIRDEVLSQLLSVGTLAVPAEWALHLLAAHTRVQTILRSSLARYDDEYLAWTTREALRLCPSTYWIQRRAARDNELSGALVRVGDLVSIHVPRVHRHPQFWNEPDKFRPERFGEGPNWRRAWMPFGRGPRLCVGHSYSFDVIKNVIACVVNSHFITAKPQRISALATGFSLIPRPCPSLTFTRL